SIEPQFCAQLLALTGLDKQSVPHQMDQAKWPEMKGRLADVIRTKTRDEWCAIMEGTDVCFAPVLSMSEAPSHPHLRARSTFVERDGFVQPAPAPRFSRTPGEIQGPPAVPGRDTDAALGDWGVGADAIAKLRASGAIA
ncbi:MAG: CoA transferase, partial [Alphaproteobacteria bacterium]